MEITCGEAPYLVSRYDTTTTGEWLKMAQEAYKNIYGYEWQGDNLLLAREALLITFIEYYTEKFGEKPQERSIKYIAYIIAWNVFQMDGLKGVRLPMNYSIR